MIIKFRPSIYCTLSLGNNSWIYNPRILILNPHDSNARRSITREHSITPYHFHKPHFEQSNSTFNQVFPMRLFRFLRTSKSFEQLPLNLRFVGVIKLESAKLWPFKPSRKAVLRRKSTLLDKYFSRRTRLGNKKIGRDREKERRKKKEEKKEKYKRCNFKYFLGTKSREGY